MPNWELVVIDDGSSDATTSIVERYQDKRITLVHGEHRGVSGLGDSYNLGLRSTRAPLVAILEGDDYWPKHKLRVQCSAFDDDSVVLSYGKAVLVDSTGKTFGIHRHVPGPARRANSPLGGILVPLIATNFIVAATVMLRRGALEDVGGFYQPKGVPYVDHPTWLRLAHRGTFAYRDEILGFWRRHPSQITTTTWLTGVPDRSAYLQDVLQDAETLLNHVEMARLRDVVRNDARRQRDEAVLARARMALIDEDWRHGAALFLGAARHGEMRTQLVSAAGLAASLVRRDIEPLLGAMGRHRLPPRVQTRDKR